MKLTIVSLAIFVSGVLFAQSRPPAHVPGRVNRHLSIRVTSFIACSRLLTAQPCHRRTFLAGRSWMSPYRATAVSFSAQARAVFNSLFLSLASSLRSFGSNPDGVLRPIVASPCQAVVPSSLQSSVLLPQHLFQSPQMLDHMKLVEDVL